MNKTVSSILKSWYIPAIFIFIIALIPRVLDLSGNSVFIDEVWWMERGKYLLDNLIAFNAYNLQHGWWQFNNTVALGMPAAFLIGLFQKIFSALPLEIASRVPLAIVGAFTPVALYLFLRKARYPAIGFLAAVLLALDPVHIGLSRWAHQDMMLTLFFMLTIFAYYFWTKEEKFKWLILATVGLALAFLTKFSALIIILILLIWKLIDLIVSKRKSNCFKNLFSRWDLFFILGALVLVMIFWPGDWTQNPFVTFFQYFFNQLGVNATFDHTNFYMGEIVKDPAWHYYLVILGIRLTELALLGFFIGLFVWTRNIKKDIKFWSLLIIWIVFMVVVMSIANKKLEVRYVLPIYPALLTFAAWGILTFFQKILSYFKELKKLKNLPVVVATLVVFAVYVPILFYMAPHYYLYYNHIAGGTKGALRYTAVGVNEGIRNAALYAKEHYTKQTSILLIGHHQPFRFYFEPDYITGSRDNLDRVEVVMIESHQVQRIGEPVLEQLNDWGKLVHKVTLCGADLVYIYEKR